jgi:hypothetical protein
MTPDTAIFDDLYGSRYFSAADLRGETIRRRIGKFDVAELKDPKDGTTKRRLLIYFDNVEKALVLNKTNAQKLAVSQGKDPSKWIGVVCDIYSEMTSLGKEGVRLRPVKTPAAGTVPTDMNDSITF